MAVATASILFGGSSLLGIGSSSSSSASSSVYTFGGRLVGEPFVDMVKDTGEICSAFVKLLTVLLKE